MERIKKVCREMGLEAGETDWLRNRCVTWTRVLAVGATQKIQETFRTFHKA